MSKLIGKIQGIVNVIPTDDFIENNYVETFSGDLFKKDGSYKIINSADWNVSSNKIVFDSYDTYNISNLSTISEFDLTSHFLS